MESKKLTKIFSVAAGVLIAASIYVGYHLFKKNNNPTFKKNNNPAVFKNNNLTLGAELYNEAVQVQEKYRKLKAEGKTLDDFTKQIEVTKPIEDKEGIKVQTENLEEVIDETCISKIRYAREYVLKGENIDISNADLDNDGDLECICMGPTDTCGCTNSGDIGIDGNFIADTRDADLLIYEGEYVFRIKDNIIDPNYTQNLYFKWDGKKLRSYKNELIIQVATFHAYEDEDKEINKIESLRSQGFKAYTIFTHFKEEDWNNVYIGLFSNKKTALYAKNCYQFLNPEAEETPIHMLKK